MRNSRFGAHCKVGARTQAAVSTMGDYSYVVHDSEIICAEADRFCSIVAHTRINPGDYPLGCLVLNHFTYLALAYGPGEDGSDFFDWRHSGRVTLGHDVWIGHGAILLPGVSAGTRAAVGAGAALTKDVPPFAVATGVPARPVR